MANIGSREHNLAKGILAGAAAGIVATAAMSLFQKAQSKGSEVIKKAYEKQRSTTSPSFAQEEQNNQPQDKQAKSSEESQPATVKAAQKVVHVITGRELHEEDRAKGGSIVHYSFGTLMGALYVGLAEYSGKPRRGYGLGFGSALFLLADEISVPALGLAPPVTKTPISTHLNAWLWHAVYGTTAEAVRGWVRHAL